MSSMSRFSKTVCVFTALAASANLLAADAANWPSQPLRVIVGFPIGSAPDLQVRLIADRLAAALGQPVHIENKPGDSGNIGAAQLARESGNHTIGIVGNGQLTGAPFRTGSLSFDANRDFVPIALVASAPLVWITKASSTPRSADEFIAQARAKGQEWAYGSTGPGSGVQLATEEIKLALGLKTKHLSFANAPLILGAVLSGQIQMALLPASLVKPLVESGSLQVIAVSTARPTPLAPALPALEGIGLRGVNVEVWNALVAPVGMPAAYQKRLSAEVTKILNLRETRLALLLQGWGVGSTSAAAVTERVRRDVSTYRKLLPLSPT